MHQPRILVCAAHPFAGSVVSLALTGLGASICDAEGWHEAVRRCHGEHFCLVVVHAPGADASPSELSDRGWRPAVWGVLPYPSESGAVALLEAGFDQCMAFPLHLLRLREKVLRLLQSLPTWLR